MENKIEKKVIDYFKEQGFNCVSQKSFPELIVFCPLRSADGSPLKIPTFYKQSNRTQIIVPFLVTGVIYKKPTKKQLRQIGITISSIAVARMKGKELEFEIISLEGMKNGGNAGYIG